MSDARKPADRNKGGGLFHTPRHRFATRSVPDPPGVFRDGN
jgi:hypothetical protein